MGHRVLAAVGEPELVIPPFDPSKVAPFDFEADVERLIEQTLAEKNNRGATSVDTLIRSMVDRI
jgi:hypothetical protein